MAEFSGDKHLSIDKEKQAKSQESIDPEEYILRKRLPPKFPKRPNDIYITKKTNYTAQMTKCRKLLDSGAHESIYIHGLGSAIDRAMNIALQLKSTYSTGSVSVLSLSANTSTVDLIDDLEPLDDDHEPATRSRRSSAIHIKLSRSSTGSCDEVSGGTGDICASIKTESHQTVLNNASAQFDNFSDLAAVKRKAKQKPIKNV